MKALKFLVATFAAAFFLSACKEAPDSAGAAKAPAEPVSIAAIESEARGFPVGSTMSVRTVYVFFDPQCPHCAQLWQSAKPLKSQAKFVWIPVSLINKTSEAQGATLLAAPDPVAAMDQHEASILAKTGGISASGDTDALKASVVKNTALMTRFGFASVPTIVAQNAQTGALVSREGALPTPGLANFLGLQVPGGQ
jgi:thiol:disulfide interchange protein DsbG